MPVGERIRLDGLEQALLLRRPQSGSVDDEQDVGGTHRAFALDPLEQLLVAGFDPVDPDAGRLGEILVERFVGLVMTRRVKIEDGLFGGTRCPDNKSQSKRRNGGGGGMQRTGGFHGGVRARDAMVR